MQDFSNFTGGEKGKKPVSGAQVSQDRQARLAQKLRENLQKRKSQSRARQVGHANDGNSRPHPEKPS